MDPLNEIEELSAARSDVAISGGVDTTHIERAARRLGVRFPEDYHRYLARLGSATVGHWQIFGLGEGLPRYLDVAFMTLLERDDSSVPRDQVVVANNGAGDLICLMPDGRVARRNHDDRSIDPLADSFDQWLEERLAWLPDGTGGA